MSDTTRRDFIKGATAGAALATGVLGTSKTAWAQANDRVRVAVIGIRGRGRDHIKHLQGLKNVEIVTLCDVDENLYKPTLKSLFKNTENEPKFVNDPRKVFDDDSIDAVTVATPNHWHSLASIWAMQSGKDVYCEKPCSHNMFEGRQLANAAKHYDRICQHGTQIRSSLAIQEAIEHLRKGTIGEVYMARGLCYRWRASIGKREDSPVPEGVHYDTWLGPAPERPFSKNRFHYNWHWHWDYGNGDIGNQGVHQMDIARWGLDVVFPKRIVTGSGMFLFDDDKEIPNVTNSTFEFPDAGERGKIMTFDVRPWNTNDEKNAKVGILFYGSEGYMVIDSYSHYKIYLGRKEEEGPENNRGGNHYKNWIDAVRAHDASLLNAPIEEGHRSAALCHLGLISARLERSITFDGDTEQIVGDAEANALLTRNYRAPFVVPKITV